MLNATATVEISNHQNLATDPNQNTEVNELPKRHFRDLDPGGVPDPRSLTKRTCRSPVSDQAADCFSANREQFGGKGMFLLRMVQAGLSVPPFKCVTAQVMNALAQQPLDPHRLARYLPGIAHGWGAETSLTNIREHLNTLSASEQTKKNNWLAGLAEFIASDDYYEQVKGSEAAQHIRDLRQELNGFSLSQPVIVRSSGINEDNYGDAQAGKYLSVVQEEDDVLSTCLKVMASAYRPEVCAEGIPQPMALIIQQCIDCLYGGVAMSFQSFQNDNLMVEYTSGQPRGVVAGQSGNTPHRIDISREGREGADSYQYFAGTISSQFILHKNNNGYSEKRIAGADVQSNDGGQRLTDKMISKLRNIVTELENLLFCPVDVEFAIDHWGRLFILQVRPVTRLSGDMVFAMSIPEETLAIGEGISEGFCTGPLWQANKQRAESMPEGAIVVAHHAEDWMLGSGFLKRAGGFVLAEAGCNDHVAIVMRQRKITLMRAGGQYLALAAHHGQQATLACARFNGEPGAFIVAGDIAGKLASHKSLVSAVSDALFAKVAPSREDLSPPEGTFHQVASGFQWLTDQNARLLAFFASGGGLDYLSNPVKLSMSPQRSELLTKTEDSVNRLVDGAQAMLDGYRAFLQLAGKWPSSEVKSRCDELSQLDNRFEMLKETIQSGLKSVVLPLQAAEKGQLSPGVFRQWVADCHQLQYCLQAFNLDEAKQIRSIHELIFALHQRFVEALEPVTRDLCQGRISEGNNITYVDWTTRSQATPLLNSAGKAMLNKLWLSGSVVSLDDALIVNLSLCQHMSVIELLEHAEGGKGRTLRMTFSDQFQKPDGSDQPGKLKRMWFLAKLLKVIELDKDSDSMKLSCNAAAGKIILECHRMTSTKNMQYAFEKLLTVLGATDQLDVFLDRAIFEEDHWCFNTLAQRLDSDVVTEADRFAFKDCLFSIARTYLHRVPRFYHLLSKQHQQFIRCVQRLETCMRTSADHFLKKLMSDEIGEGTRIELLQHFLLTYAKTAMPFFEIMYPHLKGQHYVIKPSCGACLKFYVPPGQPSGGHKEKFKNALLKHGLKYASQAVLNDKDLVLPAILKHPEQLEYVSKELRNDSDIVMASVTQNGSQLQYASQKVKDNEEVVMAAVKQSAGALEYASERLRSDKNIVRIAVAKSMYYLRGAGEQILNDREFLLDLIAIDSFAFSNITNSLQKDTQFINLAISRNPEVRQYVG
ncbi:DUF4116 domain-containing protein [Endozoicomonas sp. ALB032]|uniref:DUF4116 domain-containing protein n=1 Tax=Endozoicomonas sp. ALB032 TaxID=3403082 RepID=UPI003BB5928F